MKHTQKTLSRLLVMALALVLAVSAAMPLTAHAAKAEKTVRVGWYESAYHRTDLFGRRSGYGYEYQQRLATYTGWKYEYVEGSWSELYEMLVAGKIDLLSDVSYTEARAEKILFSAESMGSEDYHAFIAPDNTEISPDDFSTFNGKKVGVNKNSIQEQLFIEWAKNHNVTANVVELSGKTPELLDMLIRGDIDVLVTLDAYGRTADIVPVCKVGAAGSYFGINMKRPDLKQDLDVAMNRIFEENRNFNQQMAEKYTDSSGISSFLTPDERAWVAKHGTIRVGYRENYLPFCGYDESTGAITGALKDFLDFAQTSEKNAEMTFEAVPFDKREEGLEALLNGEVDCLFPVTFSAYDGEQLGVIVTDPMVKTEMYAAVRTAAQQAISPDEPLVVAVNSENRNTGTFLMDKFPAWQAMYFDNNEDALRAVDSGQADMILVSNYRLNLLNSAAKQYKLSTLATGETMDLSFAVRREDDCLYSILNKVSRLIPNAAVNASLTAYSFADEHVTFSDFVRDNLATAVAVIAIITAAILLLLLRSARAEAKLSEGERIISETERDPLSGLYFRSYFMVYANRLFKEQPLKPMDAVAINVERFHTLNALSGREYGDEVLRVLGNAIREFVQDSGGIAGRTDGDHFDIYLPHRDDYQAILDRFQSCMDQVSKNADIRLRMGVMPWQEGLTPQELSDRAWSACSMVRGDYKTHLMVYNEEMRRREERNQLLQSDLGRALEKRELEVFFQPKYDIRGETPRLVSAEALVRWRHPELGLLAPDDFVPLFERSGQISAMDNYVWAVAAAHVATWRDRYGITLPVSINLSRVDLFDPRLPDILDALLHRNGLDSSCIHLEVTESAYTENADHLIGVISGLREKGFVVEMDDFGSGYSSLNMLSSMPIDVLKMDMVFIRNIERKEQDFHFVEMILDIARYLKVPVVAEGVETAEQVRLLKDAGCDMVQGYYFSKPLPAAEFEENILRRKTN